MEKRNVEQLPLSSRVSVVSGVLPQHSIDDVLAVLVSSGVTHIELTAGADGHLPAGDIRFASKVRARMADVGMSVCGVDASIQAPLGDDSLMGILEIAAELDAPFVRVFAPPFDPRVCVRGQIDSASKLLGEFASITPPGMLTLVENAPHSLAPSPELLAHIVNTESHSRTGVLYDPGSTVAEGYLQPELAIQYLGELIQHVHVKNRAMTPRDGGWLSESRSLRDGLIDWSATLDSLLHNQYGGWLSIDHLSEEPSVERLSADIDDLRLLVDAAITRASANGEENSREPQRIDTG